MMSFWSGVVAGAVGGLVTGLLAIIAVLVGAKQTATAAASADVRRDAAQVAADQRRDAAEHQRWTRDERLAAYAKCLSDVWIWIDQSTERVIVWQHGADERIPFNDLVEASRTAKRSYYLAKLLASADVDRAAGVLMRQAGEISGLGARRSSVPAPDDAALKEAQRQCAAATTGLLVAIRRELDLAPASDDLES